MRAFADQSSLPAPCGGPVFGLRGGVACEHHLAAQAGLSVLAEGGNAVDAAVAAACVEGVVNPHMFTLGGECPMLVYLAERDQVLAVNGNTMAPALATPACYRGRGVEVIPGAGILSAGVPAAVGALLTALEQFGSLPLETVLEPARLLAAEGFVVHEGLVGMPGFGIRDNATRFAEQWTATAAIYLHADGTAPAVGEVLTNPALARTLGALADAAKSTAGREAGIRAALDLFYRGDMARAIADHVREREGLITMADLAAFTTLVETPRHVDFQGTRVFKCGPWSQGPVTLQVLRLLEGFDLAGLGHNSAGALHLYIEALKLAMADREQYYGDPELVDVPMDALLGETYTAARRTLLDPERASLSFRPGDPSRGLPLLAPEQILAPSDWGHGTVHCAAADRHGNLAALTPSGGWIMGNEVVAALGFPLTTRLQTCSLDSRRPNVLAPRKRPRTTLSPCLAVCRGEGARHARQGWKMAYGTMGGDSQDQWTSQFFLNMHVFGLSLMEAIEAPKITIDHVPGSFFPHGYAPGQVRVEGRLDETVCAKLARRGHIVVREGDYSAGYICAVRRFESGVIEAGADPRGFRGRIFPALALAW